jgi:hypothetical protein
MEPGLQSTGLKIFQTSDLYGRPSNPPPFLPTQAKFVLSPEIVHTSFDDMSQKHGAFRHKLVLSSPAVRIYARSAFASVSETYVTTVVSNLHWSFHSRPTSVHCPPQHLVIYAVIRLTGEYQQTFPSFQRLEDQYAVPFLSEMALPECREKKHQTSR